MAAGTCQNRTRLRMIAAEMAAIAPHEVERLVLIDPAGLWLDAHPMPDIFSTRSG